MESVAFIGTEGGLWRVRRDGAEPVDALDGQTVTALARHGARTCAIVNGKVVWITDDDGRWHERASIDGPLATCAAATEAGVLIGTEQAHLLQLTDNALVSIDSFEAVEGRDTWYTPWGDPADVRSIAVAGDGTIHVNVHVGGVARSRDGGRSWMQTIDIESDVHQVIAHPTFADVVLVAAAAGFGISRDGGDSWDFVTAGLDAHYSRAVTVSGDAVLLSASTGPRGRRAGIYRKGLGSDAGFVRCRDGLPEWFDDNVDTACLAASGPLVVCGTSDGRVFRSPDSGQRWEMVAKGLAPVTCVLVG